MIYLIIAVIAFLAGCFSGYKYGADEVDDFEEEVQKLRHDISKLKHKL